MNFVEYLEEADGKEKYVLYDIQKDAPYKIHDEVFYTYAVSQIKAFYQLLHQLDQTQPEFFSQPVLANKGAYKAMLLDDYNHHLNIERERKFKDLPELPPLKRRQDPQMKLFKDPYNPPD